MLETILPWVPPVGYAGVAVLVVAWLVVSFTSPGPRRTVVEWIGALGLYVALLSLFVNLLGQSLQSESTLGTVAFGFLVVFFGAGLVLCLAQMLASLKGEAKAVTSPTN